MARMNSNVILQGRTVQPLADLLGGMRARSETDKIKKGNAFDAYLKDNSAAVMAGDQGALAGLIGIDAERGLGVQGQALQAQATRQGMDHADRRMALAEQAARRAQASAARAAANAKSRAEAEANAQQAQSDYIAMLTADRNGTFDPTNYGMPEGTTFDDIQPMALLAMGEFDKAVKLFEEPARPLPLSPAGKEAYDAANGYPIPAEKPELTGREQEINRAMADLGLSREDAVKFADGFIKISRHPIDGSVQIVDTLSGDVRNPSAGPDKAAGDVTPTVPTGDVDYGAAIGPSGAARTVANTAADVFGADLPFPEAETARVALSDLAGRTTIVMQAGVPGRPSNYLMQKLEEFTVQPGELLRGEEGAMRRLSQTRALIRRAIRENQQVATGKGFRPMQVSEANQNIVNLSTLLADYEAVLDALQNRNLTDEGLLLSDDDAALIKKHLTNE